MSIGYLDILDELLAGGAASLSRPYIERQVQFVLSRQQQYGGFAGRLDASDPYYTDFAVRVLSLLAPDIPEMARAVEYRLRVTGEPADVAESFNRLNVDRLLRKSGVKTPTDTADIRKTLARAQIPGGGYGRTGARGISAYATFLAGLCYEILEDDFPASEGAITAITALRQSDGGFTESPGEPAGQTNATAAALAFLTMRNALDDGVAREACRFLAEMQAEDGGLRAHAGSLMGDLLSTFTGVLSLSGIGELDRLDIVRLARFLKSAAHENGGFSAGSFDPEADVEYTYYGIGVMALLRQHVANTA